MNYKKDDIEEIEFNQDFETFKKVCVFISKCTTRQRALIINEILMLNVVEVSIKNHKLNKVSTVTTNRNIIQLNLDN